jgi:hypothetical protein
VHVTGWGCRQNAESGTPLTFAVYFGTPGTVDPSTRLGGPTEWRQEIPAEGTGKKISDPFQAALATAQCNPAGSTAKRADVGFDYVITIPKGWSTALAPIGTHTTVFAINPSDAANRVSLNQGKIVQSVGFKGLVNADLSYMNLANVDLRGYDLQGTNFTGANLIGASTAPMQVGQSVSLVCNSAGPVQNLFTKQSAAFPINPGTTLLSGSFRSEAAGFPPIFGTIINELIPSPVGTISSNSTGRNETATQGDFATVKSTQEGEYFYYQFYVPDLYLFQPGTVVSGTGSYVLNFHPGNQTVSLTQDWFFGTAENAAQQTFYGCTLSVK